MKPGRKSSMQKRTAIAGVLITVWQDSARSLNDHLAQKIPVRLEVEDVEGQLRATWNFTYKQSAYEAQSWVVKHIAAELILDNDKVNIHRLLDEIGREMPLLDPLFGE